MLLHHVMGGLDGIQGTWGYVQGGMGALSDAIASSATAHGASIFTDKVNSPSTLYPSYWLGSQDRTKSQIRKVPPFTDGLSLCSWLVAEKLSVRARCRELRSPVAAPPLAHLWAGPPH